MCEHTLSKHPIPLPKTPEELLEEAHLARLRSPWYREKDKLKQKQSAGTEF